MLATMSSSKRKGSASKKAAPGPAKRRVVSPAGPPSQRLRQVSRSLQATSGGRVPARSQSLDWATAGQIPALTILPLGDEDEPTMFELHSGLLVVHRQLQWLTAALKEARDARASSTFVTTQLWTDHGVSPLPHTCLYGL